ncbi:cytochrome P450 [Streptomyces alanosinicus]|uniref:Cytochrome P450 n=1 Tax=Streptomyces alanosinicus TaxID=68171 RepID=A0A918YUE3_9ACTN|nr:cytochrome P450 [Streptomyces alanosinicus]GHE15611.1 cytochrome P450 [Streptomyces alanosinicus]
MTTHEESVLDWPMPRSCPMLPPDRYAQLRSVPPQQVRLDDGTLAWIVSRYQDVREAMMNPALSVDNTLPGFPQRLPIPPVPRAQSFMRMDPPEHTRLRRMVMPELNKAAAKSYWPMVQDLVDGLLDTLSGQPHPVDLLPTFAFPIPALTIARILGVPDEDADVFQKQTMALTTCDPGSDAGAEAFGSLMAYLDDLVRSKEAEPADDMISRLVRRYVATGELVHEDLVAMVFLVLVAGFETTANQITLSVLMLLRQPQHAQAMLRGPEELDRTIDELLRYWSIPQDNQVRVAARDTELGGVPVRAGEGVVFAIPAANHDECVFPDAARFDPGRDARSHLAFGHGAHYCPGAPLAKMELQIALPALFRRFPGLRLAGDFADLSFRHDTVVYGLDALPVTW